MTSRIPIPPPELAADLERLSQAAAAIQQALEQLLDGRELPAVGALPNLHAARRSAQSLSVHLEASRRLTEVAQ